MKQFSVLLLALLLSVGVALADDPPGPEDDIFVDDGAVITQVGDDNDASITQEGIHAARIYQEGNENEADIGQTGINNTAFISQVGNYNDNSVTVAGEDNTAILVQQGDNMDLNLKVTEGVGRTVDIRQFGETHTVGFVGEDGKIFQSGDYNELFVSQYGEGHVVTALDGEDYIQDGDHNTINILQYGTDQTAQVGQFGDQNTMSIFQDGSDHTAVVEQRGNNHTASIHQDGNGNHASVSQK